MGWRKMPYWLRGGLIGGGFGIFFLLTALIGTFVCGWNPVDGSNLIGVCKNKLLLFTFYLPFLGAFYLVAFLFSLTGTTGSPIIGSLLYFVLAPLLLIISFFIIGTVIGFIIEKIKKSERLLVRNTLFGAGILGIIWLIIVGISSLFGEMVALGEFLFYLFISFIIGTIIGFVVGKIKIRNERIK